MEIVLYVCVAWLIETVVEWLKPLTKMAEEKLNGTEISKAVAAVLGIVAAYALEINMFVGADVHGWIAVL